MFRCVQLFCVFLFIVCNLCILLLFLWCVCIASGCCASALIVNTCIVLSYNAVLFKFLILVLRLLETQRFCVCVCYHVVFVVLRRWYNFPQCS